MVDLSDHQMTPPTTQCLKTVAIVVQVLAITIEYQPIIKIFIMCFICNKSTLKTALFSFNPSVYTLYRNKYIWSIMYILFIFAITKCE